MLYRACLFALLVGLPTAGLAQPADTSLVTLQRLIDDEAFASERFGPARWLADGSGYTTLEPSESDVGGDDLVRYDPATGAREVLVSASQLVPNGQTDPIEVADYQWSPGGRRLLLFTNTKRVWRLNTKGDYWVLDLETGRLRQLGADAAPSTLMFATFSPDGTRVAYVREHNLYVEHLEDDDLVALTTDGSDEIINGTFDWVYEEEFGLRNGFRWSPDGTHIAYWQLDASAVRDFLLINNTDSLYAFTVPIQYPKAGTTNSTARLGVVSADGGPTTWFQEDDDPSNHYLARMEWAGSSEAVLVQHLNRLQNTLDVLVGDVATGTYRTLFTERDSAWVDAVDDVHWLDGGRRFTWVSERDGWRHVYLADCATGALTLATPGAYDVVSVEHVDAAGGWLYVVASPDEPTQRFLYRTRLDGSGSPERLTPLGEGGTHSYQIAPGAEWAIRTYSSFGVPPTTDLVRLPGHETVRVLVDNAQLKARVAALDRGPARFFRVPTGDGTLLDGFEMHPPDFDSTQAYPLLFYVYGEPWGQTARDVWGGRTYLWHLMLTQQGYLVISIDNRGTPAPRGRDWRKVIYGEVGVLASADQADAARQIAQWPYVDADRIGVWGWSGGGSMTLNLLFRSPELYQMGMSVAPVPDQRYYDTIYQERYMGLPDENADGYRRGSPIHHAAGLEGNLLLVHGTGDDNVHYQGTEALINELVRLGKPFTMMAYPNRSHSIREGEGTTRHLYELLTRYLHTHLPAGPESTSSSHP